VLSLLYRADTSADPALAVVEPSTEQAPASAEVAPSSAEAQPSGAEVLTKRAQAERAYAELSATGAPVSAGQLAAAAGLSASYARALVTQFQTQPVTALPAPRPASCSSPRGPRGHAMTASALADRAAASRLVAALEHA
jgi:hypothetical protein